MATEGEQQPNEESSCAVEEIELMVKAEKVTKLPNLSPPVTLPPHSPVISALAQILMKDGSHLPSKYWHSKEHSRTRDTMTQCICHLIQRRRTHVSKDWLEKVLDVARSVEEYLYHLASSFEEYNDPATLINRLQALVDTLISEAVESHQLPSSSLCVVPSEDSSGGEEDPSTESFGRKPLHVRQVSSQGCSRVFIVKVSNYVKGKLLPSIFTFRKELVKQWLDEAKEACCSPLYLQEECHFGGPPFIADDPSTHWSEPHQLYTWWKNNVERRSKFKVLQEDATYRGTELRKIARARWCEAVVALSEIIRSSSGTAALSRLTAPPTHTFTPPSFQDILDADSLVTGSGAIAGVLHPDESSNMSYASSHADAGKTTGQTFPLKLFDLVTHEDGEVVEWVDNGRAFNIKDVGRFVNDVLPRHFKHKNLTSFQRQLNLYGFRRTHMMDRGTYYHPLFAENEREMANQIRRVNREDEGSCIDEPEPITRKRRKQSNPYAKSYSVGGIMEAEDDDDNDYDAVLVLSNRHKHKKIVIDMTTMRVEERSDNEDDVGDLNNNETELWHHRRKRVENKRTPELSKKEVGIREGSDFQAFVPSKRNSPPDATELGDMNQVWGSNDVIASVNNDGKLHNLIRSLEEEHISQQGQVIVAPLPSDVQEDDGSVISVYTTELRFRPCVTLATAVIIEIKENCANFKYENSDNASTSGVFFMSKCDDSSSDIDDDAKGTKEVKNESHHAASFRGKIGERYVQVFDGHEEYFVALQLCHAIHATQAQEECYSELNRRACTSHDVNEWEAILRRSIAEGKIHWNSFADWSREDVEAFLVQHKKNGDHIRKIWLESGLCSRFQQQSSEEDSKAVDSLSLLSSLCRSILEQEERPVDLRRSVDFYHTMCPPANGQQRKSYRSLHRGATHTTVHVMAKATELKMTLPER